MADVRVAPNVVISDPTTPSQIAAVDASGRLSVNLTASSATVTVDSELPSAAALADAASNPTVPAVGAYLVGFNGTTWDRVRTANTGRLQVDVITSPSITVDSEFPAAASITDAFANPSTTSVMGMNMLWNGTNWDRWKSAAPALDSVGTGIGNAALVGQLDDAATQTVTENQFAHVRISSRRALLVEGVASGTVIPVSLTSTTITGTVTVDSELPTAGALADATANPTTTSVGSMIHGFNGTTWDRVRTAATLADALANPGTGLLQSQNFLMGYNGTTWDRLRSTTANGLAVDVTRVQGTVTVDSELPAAAALADATSNPTVPGVSGFLMGYNGTTWDRVRVANTGRLQVDVITGGGSSTPTTPVNDYATSSAVAAGSSANHDTADFGAATKRVWGIVVGASVPCKWLLQYVDNSVATTMAVFWTAAGDSKLFTPAHPNFWAHTFTANAGVDAFRVVMQNMDPSEAADVYSTIQYGD